MGGHLVQGHVDGVGHVVALTRQAETARLTIEWRDQALAPLLIPQGSVAVDGVSLTVARLNARDFEIMIIPHTLAATTLGGLRKGQRVNLEMDMIGKYVQRMLQVQAGAAARPGEASRRRAERIRGPRRADTEEGSRVMEPPEFVSIEEGIEEIRAGRMLIVVDDEDRENEGDLLMAAEKATPEAVNFMAKYGRGLICMPMLGERLDELQISMMVSDNTAPLGHRLHGERGRRAAA